MHKDGKDSPAAAGTRAQLLDAAERLFAAQGVAPVSVRDIIREARANLGAVNYHFGTRQALVVEVFERRLIPVDRARLAALDALEREAGRAAPPLEEILTAFIRPALQQAADPAQGGTASARLLGRSLGEPNPALETALRRHFEPVARRFDAAIGRALPSLPRRELMCRMHLVIGALHQELMAMDRPPPPQLRRRRSLANIEKRLVSFAAAGLRASLLVAALLVLGGCTTVGPDYQAPAAPHPAAWSASVAPDLAPPANGIVETNALERWWTVFDDPILTNLIVRAQAGNQDLCQAQARVLQARAEWAIARGDRLPTLTADGLASYAYARAPSGGGVASSGGGVASSGSGVTRTYANTLDASWELDLFGGKRRAVEAADATWQAAQEDLHDTLVTLCAEVALNYVNLRAYQTRLSITESNLASQVETYDIARWRCEARLASQLDVEQARLTLEQTRATVPTLRTSLDQAKHQLATLLGLEPGALYTLLEERRPVPAASRDIALRMPVDVIRQRPDVRRTERKLAAQTAEIGVAEAKRYPSFTLSGSIGLEALEARNLYTAGARTANGAAAAAWTLFDGGKIRQNIAEQTALRDEALGLYQATILTALQDVEDALVAYANEQTRRRALADAAEAARNAFVLARDKYTSGLIDFSTLQTAQQSLLTAQDSQAAGEADVTSDLIRLYKALGGGWTSLPPETTPADGKP